MYAADASANRRENVRDLMLEDMPIIYPPPDPFRPTEDSSFVLVFLLFLFILPSCTCPFILYTSVTATRGADR